MVDAAYRSGCPLKSVEGLSLATGERLFASKLHGVIVRPLREVVNEPT